MFVFITICQYKQVCFESFVCGNESSGSNRIEWSSVSFSPHRKLENIFLKPTQNLSKSSNQVCILSLFNSFISYIKIVYSDHFQTRYTSHETCHQHISSMAARKQNCQFQKYQAFYKLLTA